MGHPVLFSRACDINKARLNNSDVPFYRKEYMFYHTSKMEGNILHFILTALRLLSFIKHDRKT